MPKLSPIYDYRKNGSRNVKAYRISLQKTECEKHGFSQDSDVTIEYFDNKIVIKKEEN